MTNSKQHRDRESFRHAVYRVYDADHRPLYYGSSHDPHGRLAEHARDPAGRQWYGELASVELDWYGTRFLAQHAEWAAVTRDKPYFNVLGVTKPWPEPKPPKSPRDLRPFVMQAARSIESEGRGSTEDDLILRTRTYLPHREANAPGIRDRITEAIAVLSAEPIRAWDPDYLLRCTPYGTGRPYYLVY